jgi:uncharacterized protein YbcI
VPGGPLTSKPTCSNTSGCSGTSVFLRSLCSRAKTPRKTRGRAEAKANRGTAVRATVLVARADYPSALVPRFGLCARFNRTRYMVDGTAFAIKIQRPVCPRFPLGWRSEQIHTHHIKDLLVIRIVGVLTLAERQLGKSLSPEKGRNLIKQVRKQLLELARPMLESLVHEVAGVKVLSMHHDISTVTGEEVVIFSLAAAPRFH